MNEALLTSLSPVLSAASVVHVFFHYKNVLYRAWSGHHKKVYRGLLRMFDAVLVLPWLSIDPSKIVLFIDTSKQHSKFEDNIRKSAGQAPANPKIDTILTGIVDDEEDEDDHQENAALTAIDQNMGLLAATQAQIYLYQHTKFKK